MLRARRAFTGSDELVVPWLLTDARCKSEPRSMFLQPRARARAAQIEVDRPARFVRAEPGLRSPATSIARALDEAAIEPRLLLEDSKSALDPEHHPIPLRFGLHPQEEHARLDLETRSIIDRDQCYAFGATSHTAHPRLRLHALEEHLPELGTITRPCDR